MTFLAETARPFLLVVRNQHLRRLSLSWAALVLGGSYYQIALAVVAFRLGGAQAVGLALMAQILPVAIVGPLTSVIADRVPRVPLMVTIDGIRCLCSAAVAVATVTTGSLLLILVLGAPGALCSSVYGPAARALLPSLAREPDELTAANVVSSSVEHVGLLVGPAFAGILLAFADPGWVFAVGAAMFGLSGIAVSRLTGGRDAPPGAAGRGGWRRELTAGVRTVASHSSLRILMVLYAVQAFIAGALQVFIVVVAHDIAGLGDPGVAELFSALGVGGLVGGVVAATLARRRTLSVSLAFGVLVVGAALALIGLWPAPASRWWAWR